MAEQQGQSDEKAPHPADNGTTHYGLGERSVILCRTCMRPITWETRTEPGYLPRTGFYDDARVDPLICFKAVNYRHEPLSNREWAYYEAGQRSASSPGRSQSDRVVERDEFVAEHYSELVDMLLGLGIEDADHTDGSMLADSLFCAGWQKQRTRPGMEQPTSDGGA